MKVVLSVRAVFPFHGIGGMQLYVYQLARHLIGQGVKAKIVTYPPDRKHLADFDSSIEFTFLRLHELGKFMPGFLTYQHFNGLLADHLRHEDFDILHAFGITSAAYLRGKRQRKPTVVQAFGSEPLKNRTGLGKIKAQLWKAVLKHCMRAADGIASQGERQTEEIQAFYDVEREKIFCLPSGIDFGLIQNYLAARRLSREELGIAQEDFLVLSVGRLVPYKGIDRLLEAVCVLRKRLDSLKVMIVGSGPDEARIETLIDEYGLHDLVIRRKDIGERELFECYALADVFVMASSKEGFPLVTLEAAACGLPIVATDVGENPQVVREGENGYLIPPFNSQAIVEAIWQVYSRAGRKEMGETSRKIAQQYNWPVIAKMAISEYEKLIKANQ